MSNPTIVNNIRAIFGSVIAIILIIIAAKGYFDQTDGWGWWLFGAAVSIAFAFTSDDEEKEEE